MGTIKLRMEGRVGVMRWDKTGAVQIEGTVYAKPKGSQWTSVPRKRQTDVAGE